MVRAMLLMLFVLERLQLMVRFLGVDNWDCGSVQTGRVRRLHTMDKTMGPSGDGGPVQTSQSFSNR